MKHTQHYKLNKPEPTVDYFDIEDANANMDMIDGALYNKVEKIEGKGLSTEDYTTAEKNKLTNIDDDANNYSHPATHIANMIKTTSERRFITDALLAKLNGIEAWVAGLYEPIIAKKSGFNLDKSDSVSSTSSVLLATAKAVKTAYDKAVSALNVANGKETAFSKNSGFNLNKSDSVTSTSSSTLATSAAASTAYNKGVEALNKANTKLDATYGDSLSASTSFTLSANHKDRVICAGSSSSSVITVPKNVFGNGDQITVLKTDSGNLTFASASGVTIYSRDSKRSIKGLYGSATLVFVSATTAYLFGSLE